MLVKLSADGSRGGALRLSLLAGAAAGALLADSAFAANFIVDDQASFENAMQQMVLDKSSSHTIEITGDFTMSGPVAPIVLDAGQTVTINGNGHTINGANAFRPFFAQSGTTEISNLTIADAAAIGGSGSGGGMGAGGGLFVGNDATVVLDLVNFSGNSARGGAGGSANTGGGGLGGSGGEMTGGGGGLFGTGGDSGGGGGGTLGSGGSNVEGGGGGFFGNGSNGSGAGAGGGGGGLTVDASGAGSGGGAEGGDGGTTDAQDGQAFGGGGGGSAFNAGNGAAGGGGGAAGANTGTGGNGGLFGGGGAAGRGSGYGGTAGAGGDYGGGGAAGGTFGSGATAGNGGFGGGGGGAVSSSGIDTAGNGGFGGGGGAGSTAGTGGFGGGAGSDTGGGGGAAFGGAVFVRSGGTLIVRGAGTIGAGTVTGGAGAGADGGGSAAGDAIFLQDAAVVFETGSGETQSVLGSIADDTGNGASGGGVVVKSGEGTLELSGANSYSGGTTLLDGVVAVSSDANLGAAGGALTFGDGVLRFDAAFDIAATRAIVMDGFAGGIDTNGFDTTLSQAVTGTDSFSKYGEGTLTLTADGSALDGDLVVEEGELALDGGSLTLGGLAQVGGGTMKVLNGADLVTLNPILGVGIATSMVVDGRGTTVTSNGLTGILSVFGPTFGPASLTISGGAVYDSLGGAALFGIGGDAAMATVTGAGSVWKVDNVLTIGCGCSDPAEVVVAEGGRLVSTGLTGIGEDGVLRIGTGGSAGVVETPEIVNEGRIVADFTDYALLDANISGAGTLTKQASGELELSGKSSYTGATFVNGGLLSVNGDISASSLLTVAPGATVGGVGRLPATTVSGTFAPGNSIGTVTVAGDLVFAPGSTYRVEVDPKGADRTNVVAAPGGTGKATLTGATVAASYAAGTYVARSYTILSAAGGLGGTSFAGLTGTLPAGFEAELAYDANNAYLVLDLAMRPTDPEAPEFGSLNRNQRSVADAIVGYFDATGGIPADFAALNPTGLSLVSGEARAGAVIAGFQSADRFLDLIASEANRAGRPQVSVALDAGISAYAEQKSGPAADRFAALDKQAAHAADQVGQAIAPGWTGWGAAYGGSLTVDGDAVVGSHDAKAETFALASGFSARFGDTLVGTALGGGWSNFDLSDGMGSGDAGVFNAGLYGRQGFGPAYVSGALAYGFYDFDTTRGVPGDTLTGDFNAHSWSGRVEGGYRFDMPVAALTPYAAFQAIAFHVPGYSESSAAGGLFGLDYAGDTLASLRTELGLKLDRTLLLDDGGLLTLSGRTAWAINGGDDNVFAAGFQALPGTGFVITGVEADANAALIDAGAEYRSPSGFFASVAFQGEFSSNVNSYSGNAKIGFTW